MVSGYAKSAIDRVVSESFPLKWTKSRQQGETLGDFMAMDAKSILDDHADYLKGIIEDAVHSLSVKEKFYPRMINLPVDITSTKPVERNMVLHPFDQVVDYIMVWSKKMGYDTCEGHMTYGDFLKDVDPFTFNDQFDLDEFYYVIRDMNFFVAASKWVAEKFYLMGIITQNSVNALTSRAKEQPHD